MKRQWRVGRLVLGVMLVNIAALAYWIWPGVNWKLKGERAIGFDIAKGQVYTVKSDEGKHELRGYDLWNGERRVTVGLEPDTRESDMETTVLQGNTPQETIKAIASAWQWLLSPSRRELITFNSFQRYIQILDIETGKVTKKLIGPDTPPINRVGFSNDGNWLSMSGRDSDAVTTWNVKTGEILDVVKPKPLDHLGSENLLPLIERNRIHIEPHGRYITYAADDGAYSAIRDIVLKKDVFGHSYRPSVDNLSRPGVGGFPRFYDDGRVVVFTPPRIDKTYKAARFRLTGDGKWQADPLELATGKSKCDFVSYCADMLVTDCYTIKEAEQPGWLPELVWEWVTKLFALQGVGHRLQFWDVHTGRMVREFSFFESMMRAGNFLQGRTFVSEDAKWLAEEDRGEVTLYEVTGRRTAWCWIVVMGFVLLAAWSGWPRRVGKAC